MFVYQGAVSSAVQPTQERVPGLYLSVPCVCKSEHEVTLWGRREALTTRRQPPKPILRGIELSEVGEKLADLHIAVTLNVKKK